jgi:hypothetical protein
MVDLAEIQAAYYMVAATGVLVAAAYYILNMRATLETRQVQLFMDLYKTYSSKDNQKDRDAMQLTWKFDGIREFIEKYGAIKNPDEHAKWDTQVAQYVGMGVLVRRGMIKPELVFDLINDSFTVFWEKFLPIIKEHRVGYLSSYAQDAEYLYDEMKRIAAERGVVLPEKNRTLVTKYGLSQSQ